MDWPFLNRHRWIATGKFVFWMGILSITTLTIMLGVFSVFDIISHGIVKLF